MLDLLERIVRRQDIDDAQIVDRVEVLVRLVRRADPALVLVEQEVLPLPAGVLLGEDVGGRVERLGVGLPDDAAHGHRFGGLGAFAFAHGGFAADDGDVGLPRTKSIS